MSNIKQLRDELDTNGELAELLDVLKGIAVAEFRVLEGKRERFDAYLDHLQAFFGLLDWSDVDHPFAADRGRGRAVIAVSADEGFTGGLNERVMKAAVAELGEGGGRFIVVGERGAEFLRSAGHECVRIPGAARDNAYEAALRIKSYVMEEGLKGAFDRLTVVYPRPVSFMVQKVETLPVLPCAAVFARKEGRYRDRRGLLVESRPRDLVQYLVGAWMTHQFYHVLEDSRLSELSARTVQLEQSYQSMLRRETELRFRYFRSRHEQVDKSMRETFSAAIIRRKKAALGAEETA